MLTRRSFLRASTAAFAAQTLHGAAKSSIPIGAQIYTVRNLVGTEGLPEVLSQIRSIGYREVELIPQVYSHSAAQLRQTIAASGLTAPSGHFSYQDFPTSFDYARALGLRWMVCPVIARTMWNENGFRSAASQFNAWGKQARAMGMRFAFHDHDYEFRKMNGATGFEILVNNTEPDLVFFELDCYWIAQAGLDPVQTMKRLGPRVKLLHLKDRKPGFPPSTDTGPAAAHFTEVGRGTLNWPAILAESRRLDVEYYFVEQDRTDGPPMDSLRISYDYLRKILGSSNSRSPA